MIFRRRKFYFSSNTVKFIITFSIFSLVPLIGCLNPIKTNALAIQKKEIKNEIENKIISKITKQKKDVNNKPTYDIRKIISDPKRKKILDLIQQQKDFNVSVLIKEKGKVIKKEMPFSEYLFGVLMSENGGAPPEALKAQLVAITTYAIKNFKLDQDIQTGNRFQTFISLDEIKRRFSNAQEKYDMIFPVDEKGNRKFDFKILVDEKGEPVECVYDTCGGRSTRNNEDVWGNGNQHLHNKNLTSVRTPEVEELEKIEKMNENERQKYAKENPQMYDLLTKNKDKIKPIKKIKLEEAFKAVKNSRKEAKMPSNNSEAIKILSRFTDSTYVKEVEIFGVKVSGEFIRRTLKVPSADFDVKFENNEFIFQCYGCGHGCGMSQIGANLLALKGETCENILKHYYNNIRIASLKDFIATNENFARYIFSKI